MFLAVSGVLRSDDIEAGLHGAGSSRESAVDEIYYTVTGMLSAKKPRHALGYHVYPQRRARIV